MIYVIIWIGIAFLFVGALVAAARRPLPPVEAIPIHVEWIECPSCQRHQEAIVEHTEPFNSYVHWCIQCDYCIMEQEWQKV